LINFGLLFWPFFASKRLIYKKVKVRRREKMKLGQRVKKLRKKLGLTQKQFAQRIPGKVDHTYIGKIERGQYPSLKLLERIAKAFSVPLSYFFEDDSFPKS